MFTSRHYVRKSIFKLYVYLLRLQHQSDPLYPFVPAGQVEDLTLVHGSGDVPYVIDRFSKPEK